MENATKRRRIITLVLLVLVVCCGWFYSFSKKSTLVEKTTGDSRAPHRAREVSRIAPVDLVTFAGSYPEGAKQEQEIAFLARMDEMASSLNEEALLDLVEKYKKTKIPSERILLSRLLNALYSVNPSAALNLYAESNIAKGGLGVRMLENALSKDRDSFIKWAESGVLKDARGDILQSICIVLGRSGFDDSIKIINAQDKVVAARMAAMIFQNFGGTMQEAEVLVAMLDGATKSEAVMGIVRRFKNKFPEQCFDLLASVADEDPGNRVMDGMTYVGLFKSLFVVDGAGALTKMEGADVARVQELLSNRDLLNSAIECEPSKTIALLNRIVPTKSNSQLFSNAVFGLAKVDPKVAFEWVLSMPGGASELRSSLIGRSVELWAQKDADSAREAYLELSPGERGGATEGLAKAAALGWKGDSGKILAWTDNLTGPEYSTYVRSASEFIAFQAPQAAADLLLDASREKISPEDLSHASRVVGQHYANRLGVERALQWIDGLPPSIQPMAVGGVVEHWMGADPQAASAWISEELPGPSRDAAVQVLIEQIKDTDPQMAEKWRKSLSVPQTGTH